MTALGFIETKGLVAAINGADAMLKAAEVRLLGKDLVGGGLVTITVAGEVAAVRASVDAGIAAVRSIAGALVSEHVIARPDVELGNIIVLKTPAAPSVPPTVSPSAAEVVRQGEQASSPETLSELVVVSEEIVLEIVSESADAAPVTSSADVPAATKGKAEKPKSALAATHEIVRHEAAQLRKMGVNRLRQIARSLSGIAMTPEKIASADKKVLIEKIINAYRQIEE